MKFLVRSYGTFFFSAALIWSFWLQIYGNPSKSGQEVLRERWFVTEKEVSTLFSKKPLVLDTRSLINRKVNPLREAKPLAWESLSREDKPNQGKLLGKEAILKELANLGIERESEILVVGDGYSGFGEEGRIVWSLREVGFGNSYFLNGRWNRKSLEQAIQLIGIEKNSELKNKNGSSYQNYTIEKNEILGSLNQSHFKVLDVREPREFSGSTPYGEARGGHIPNAISLYFKDLMQVDSSIRSQAEVDSLLKKLNIKKDDTIAVYCTGGIRSAWVVGVLRTYGYNAKNYPGSMWEWSEDTKLPLTR